MGEGAGRAAVLFQRYRSLKRNATRMRGGCAERGVPSRCSLLRHVSCGDGADVGHLGTLAMADKIHSRPTYVVFGSGVGAGFRCVFPYVLFGTYIGIGALAHDFGFSLVWVLLSTLLIWAGPAQLILISGLGTGATLMETAIAVTLSAVRLLPMVASLLPIMRTPQTPTWHLVLPAHFTAISTWAESIRLLPTLPRHERVAFCNGIGAALLIAATCGTGAGYFLSGKLPTALSASLLFLTPLSFITSMARNARQVADRVALGLGFVIGPILSWANVGLELMWTGIVAGTIAYVVHRVWKSAK